MTLEWLPTSKGEHLHNKTTTKHTNTQATCHASSLSVREKDGKEESDGERSRQRSRQTDMQTGETDTHIEAGCPVQQLNHMSDTGLGGLVELLLLQLLHHVENNVLAGEERATFQHFQNQLERLFLHDGAQELAAATADGGPQQCRDLLLVLVHH